MFSFMSNKLIRRGTGVLAVFAFVAICFVIVPNSYAADDKDRNQDRTCGDKNIERAEGDVDGVGGARVKIHAEVTETGECGGGAYRISVSHYASISSVKKTMCFPSIIRILLIRVR
jgi:hypothetical protein